MGPVPEEHQNNPEDRDLPNDSDSEELEMPNHNIPPPIDTSSEEDDDGDSDGEGPANDGYMLLPQDPEEEGVGDGGEEAFQSQALPPLSALEVGALPSESMTEVRGAGVDVTQAVAEGNVHPAFAASFPDNKVPVHLQVPALPKAKKDDVLWNHAAPEADRLQLDSAHLSKVKSAMAGFQLPKANVPEWARHISEDEWKQHLIHKLTSPSVATTTSAGVSASGPSKLRDNAADIECSEKAEKECSQCSGASGT